MGIWWLMGYLNISAMHVSQVLTLLCSLFHCPVWLAQQPQEPKALLPLCCKKLWDNPAHGLQHSGDVSVEAWALQGQHCSRVLDVEGTNNCCYNWLKSKRGTDGSWGKHLTLHLTEGSVSSQLFTATGQQGMFPSGIVIYALFLAIWGKKSLLGGEWSF